MQSGMQMDFQSLIIWNNPSFHHWFISTTQHLVLLLLFTILSFLHLCGKSNMHIFLCTFTVNHKCFLMCFDLWPYFWATWYFPVKSVKVFISCFSSGTSRFVYLCASFSLMTFHFICDIWLQYYISSQDKPCIFYNHNLKQAIGIDLVLHQ